MQKRKLLIRQQMSVGSEDGLYTTIPPLFDVCGQNDLVSLSLSGVNPLLDWLGWVSTKTYRLVRDYVLYVRSAGTAGEGGETPSAGWLCDPCDDPKGVEWAHDQLEIEGFGRLARMSPVRDTTMVGMNYCEISPRYRLDGATITDDLEYDIIRATEVVIQDLLYQVLNGNADTCGQMDGLPQIITDAYTNPMLNSIVVDWNGNGMSGGAGETINGYTIPSDASFVDLLIAIVRRIRTRIGMVPIIRSSNLGYGDIVLAMPNSFIPCLLDAYACWSVCPGSVESGAFNSADIYRIRDFRNALNGGAFGAGEITIEGLTIPILPVDQLITGFNTFDAYLLTRGVGGWRWLYGQYNDMDPVAALTSAKTGKAYASLDGGRILNWAKSENTCLEQFVEMQTRLVCEAPWAQAVIQDVKCDAIGGPLSTDPWSNYFPYNLTPLGS
jgi:hypothetical protein